MNSLQQSSSEEFVASRISQSPTGQIRLLESIPDRKNMQRALHLVRSAMTVRQAMCTRDEG